VSHTPGPWIAQIKIGSIDSFRILSINPSVGCAKCLVCELDRRANANLIAAAPELLEALEAALNFIDDPKQQARAVAVIEKARGE